MALHTWDHRITMTDFRLCSSCRSRSQAGFCHCTHQLISDQLEPTSARLRYNLGGDRPSQTRSEEHTSELQSHSFISYAVFCLKKKKKTPYHQTRVTRSPSTHRPHYTRSL